MFPPVLTLPPIKPPVLPKIPPTTGKLNLDNRPFRAGINDAKARHDQLLREVGSRVPKLPKPDTKGWGAGMSAFFGGIGGVLAAQLTSGLQGDLSAQSVGTVLGGALGGVVGLIGGPVGAVGGAIAGGIFGSITDGIGRGIDGLARRIEQGTSLGLEADTFTGLSEGFADFGLEGDKVLGMFGRLNESAAGLGVTGDTLEQKLFNAADMIKNAGNASQQASMAYELFGKSALKVLPVLSQGAEGMKAMIAEQSKLGTGVGFQDFSQLNEARNAMDRVGDAMTGIWNKILIAAAPVITFVSDGLADWIEWFGQAVPWTEIIHGGFRLIGTGASYAIDTIKLIGEIGLIAFEGIWDAIKNLADAIVKLVNGALKMLAGALGDLWDMAKQFGLAMFDSAFSPETAKKLTEAFGRFGNTATEFQKSFDAIANKKFEKPALGVIKEELVIKQTAPIQYQPVAAAVQGSREAASIEARFKFQNLLQPKQNEALNEAKKGNGLLEKIKQGIDKLLNKDALELEAI